MHTADDTPATTLPYAPAPQDVQALVPVANELYRPAAHDVHTADVDADATLPYAPAAPAVHTGPAVEIAPPALYVPTRQAAHPPEPDCLPYPGAQLRAAITTSSTVSTRDVAAADT